MPPLFNHRWWKTTILVLLASGVMVRLGFWQLDRLEERLAFNTRVSFQLSQPPLDLKEVISGEQLVNMEYREIIVVGEYDHANEVVLRNQVWGNEYGVHLLTPLKILGSDHAVLVDRGWIPMEKFLEEDWSEFHEPGKVEVKGLIRRSQNRPEIGRRSDPIPEPGEGRLLAWHLANVEGISQQLPYTLLPVYVQQYPDPTRVGYPYRELPTVDLSEGSHLGYAIQWFVFSAILFFGYPFFVIREEREEPVQTDNRRNAQRDWDLK